LNYFDKFITEAGSEMPKDYFEVEVTEEVLSEEDRQAKVIEFVYQVTRKTCEVGEFTSWLQDGK
jgi:hypothetical protein